MLGVLLTALIIMALIASGIVMLILLFLGLSMVVSGFEDGSIPLIVLGLFITAFVVVPLIISVKLN